MNPESRIHREEMLRRAVLAGDEEGIGTDMPISLSTNQVALAAALQRFEDAYPQLQFVLRDYGILVTTKAYARSHGYMPVLELGKTADVKAH